MFYRSSARYDAALGQSAIAGPPDSLQASRRSASRESAASAAARPTNANSPAVSLAASDLGYSLTRMSLATTMA